jgi:transcriptional antiterminator RfaH
MDHPQRTAPQWFALRVKSRHEHVVALAIQEKGFDEFLPLYQRTAQWSDRTKTIPSPLFPGYLFCRLSPEDRFHILTIPGALHFVANGKELIPMAETEIHALQVAVRAKLNAEPIPFVDHGPRLLLNCGPLAGVQGFLVEEPRRRLVISLSSFQRSVAIEMEGMATETSDDNGSSPSIAVTASGQ